MRDGTLTSSGALSLRGHRALPLDPGGVVGLGSRRFGQTKMPDAQLIEILIAAMVAGVILFRLYTVLGRRTGHEPQPQDRINPVLSVANLRALPADRPAEPQARSLFDIQLADPSFETGHFLKGARSAYEIILKAFAGGDRASLKPLLSDEVYKAFDGEIAK